METDILGVLTTPIWDSAGRTITALTHEWTVQSVIWVDPLQVEAGLDSAFSGILAQLTRPGDTLILQNTGWGSFEINPAGGGGTRDLMWGPKPQLVAFNHQGYKYAVKVTWKVFFCLDACGGNIRGQKILEFNYKLNFSQDQSGYTRRTYSGHVSIPLTRRAQNDGTLADQADRLREQITPPLIIGFRRTTFEFPLADGKPPVTEVEFRELAEWFATNETRLWNPTSQLLKLGDGRTTSLADLRYGISKGPRQLHVTEVVENLRHLRQNYGDAVACQAVPVI